MAQSVIFLSLFGAAQPALARESTPSAIAGETAFALGGLLCGAGASASPAQRHLLHTFLLDCPADPATDIRFGIRPAVRREVARWPVSLRARAVAWLVRHPLPVTHLTAVTLTLYGPAPLFAEVPDAEVTGITERWSPAERAELGGLLREAWSVGQLGSLWRTLLPTWRQAQPSAARIAHVLQKTRQFLRLPIEAPLNLRYVAVDPMLPTGAALSSMFSEADVGILLGPSASCNQEETLLVHELLHPLLNFFVTHNPRAQNSLALASCVFYAARENRRASFAATKVYAQWDVYFTETTVRVLSHRIAGTPGDNDGFLLAREVDWELDRFEVEHFGFENLWTRSLARLESRFCTDRAAGTGSAGRATRVTVHS